MNGPKRPSSLRDFRSRLLREIRRERRPYRIFSASLEQPTPASASILRVPLGGREGSETFFVRLSEGQRLEVEGRYVAFELFVVRGELGFGSACLGVGEGGWISGSVDLPCLRASSGCELIVRIVLDERPCGSRLAYRRIDLRIISR